MIAPGRECVHARVTFGDQAKCCFRSRCSLITISKVPDLRIIKWNIQIMSLLMGLAIFADTESGMRAVMQNAAAGMATVDVN